MEPWVIVAVGGVLPFGSIFIEMYFIFTSFWAYKIYYVYGFMLLGKILTLESDFFLTNNIFCSFPDSVDSHSVRDDSLHLLPTQCWGLQVTFSTVYSIIAVLHTYQIESIFLFSTFNCHIFHGISAAGHFMSMSAIFVSVSKSCSRHLNSIWLFSVQSKLKSQVHLVHKCCNIRQL